MKKIWLILVFLVSALAAADAFELPTPHYKNNIVLYAPEQDLAVESFLSVLENNLLFSGRFNTEKHYTLMSSWHDYKTHEYDYLLVVKLTAEQVDISLRSIWNSTGTPQDLQENMLIQKSFSYHNQEELRHIAHQMSDEILGLIDGQKGFAAYPIAYIIGTKNQYHLAISDLYHQNEKILYTTDHPIAGMSWSPDGRSIVFVEMLKKGAVLKTLKCRSGHIETLIQSSYLSSPIYSSDQRYIYFIGLQERVPQIFQYQISNKQQTVLTQDQAWILDLQRGSDPYHLLVSSERSGQYQIYEFNILSKSFKRLTFQANPCISAVFNQERQSLFFCEIADKKSLMIERSFIEARSRYVTVIGEAEEMSFAPYADLAVYEQSYQGVDTIVVKSLKTGQEYVWPHDPGHTMTKPSWAPRPLEK